MCSILTRFPAVVVRALAVFVLPLVLVQPGHAKPRTLIVPTAYPTIQVAVDAAANGDVVQVLAGNYVEQLQITKNVTIVGAGKDSTIIRAPSSLRETRLKEASIVEIFSGATVAMSRLTVAGPGPGTCKKGALQAGIRLPSEAHPDLTFSHGRAIP